MRRSVRPSHFSERNREKSPQTKLAPSAAILSLYSEDLQSSHARGSVRWSIWTVEIEQYALSRRKNRRQHRVPMTKKNANAGMECFLTEKALPSRPAAGSFWRPPPQVRCRPVLARSLRLLKCQLDRSITPCSRPRLSFPAFKAPARSRSDRGASKSLQSHLFTSVALHRRSVVYATIPSCRIIKTVTCPFYTGLSTGAGKTDVRISETGGMSTQCNYSIAMKPPL